MYANSECPKMFISSTFRMTNTCSKFYQNITNGADTDLHLFNRNCVLFQVVAATSQALSSALSVPRGSTTLTGALAGFKNQTLITAALNQNVGVRQSSPVRIQTSSAAPLVAVTVQNVQQQQQQQQQQQAGLSQQPSNMEQVSVIEIVSNHFMDGSNRFFFLHRLYGFAGWLL